ncbi:MAG: ferrous iron transport protein A [Oscillospiraceae bacterium]|jgi:ferrous iron transport protein A|nr:ferrous iron transport protein A [Oscillospiraceae bacterium]
MTLRNAQPGKEYIIQSIHTGDRELEDFLFCLGCFPGEPITLVSRRWSSSTVAIKDGRYSIDRHLAEAIRV